jgi:hypothetical protein
MSNPWSKTAQDTVEQWIQNSPLRDLSQNAKTFLIGALQKMDVVTREEYDVQVALLARTREKLEALEQQVAALEQQRSSN